MKKLPQLPNIPEEEQTPLVKTLLALLEQYSTRIVLLEESVAGLKDEINILKSEKKRPEFKPRKLDKSTGKKTGDTGDKAKKRAGSDKRSKTAQLKIHEDVCIVPDSAVRPGSRFKGYRDFVVQDLIITSHNTRYRLVRWINPQGDTLNAELPAQLNGRYLGTELVRFILYQHHHCQATQPMLLEQLHEYGVDISTSQIDRILSSDHEELHDEKDGVLQVGLQVSTHVTVDDSGAQHKGKNGYVTHIGNEHFAWFKSTETESRLNFLCLVRAGHQDYCLSGDAIQTMEQQKLPQVHVKTLRAHLGKGFENEALWLEFLDSVNIRGKRLTRIASEGALLGSVLSHGFCKDLVIVYTELKAFKDSPEEWDKEKLTQRFDQIFTHKTQFATLNRLLKRIHANKADPLQVLERPEIPLHTSGSETDIRDYVIKRKVSGGTRSDEGQRCRDTFISLEKTLSETGHLILGLLARSPVFARIIDSTPIGAGARTSLCPGLLRSYRRIYNTNKILALTLVFCLNGRFCVNDSLFR